MNKYEITVVQSKALTIEIEGKTADDAVAKAKQEVNDSSFVPRIGVRIIAGVREIDDRNPS